MFSHIYLLAISVSVIILKDLYKTVSQKTDKGETVEQGGPIFGSEIMTVNIYDAIGQPIPCVFEEPIRLTFQIKSVCYKSNLPYA